MSVRVSELDQRSAATTGWVGGMMFMGLSSALDYAGVAWWIQGVLLLVVMYRAIVWLQGWQ